MTKAIEYFEQAIEKDPSYALAYVGMADSYITLAEWQYLPAKEAFPKAREAALKALEIDDSLGEAHASLAAIKADFDWDWKEAEKKYQRAIELSPSYATAHQWYGELLDNMGRFDEALKEIKRAQELDPLSLIVITMEAQHYCFARDYDKGIDQCRKTLDMDPDFSPAHFFLCWNYLGKGMYEEALNEGQIFGNQYSIALIYAWMHRQEEARRSLANIIEHPLAYEVEIAMIYLLLGENEEGWKWFEKAYNERSRQLVFLKVDFIYDNIRPDPRFQALLKKVGFD
jgi:Tfp pilus assembly protein PilF